MLIWYVDVRYAKFKRRHDSLSKEKRLRRRTIPDDCPDCYTIEDFCKDHPKGTFVIGTGSHLATVIDGTLFDSWNSLAETPVYYFEKSED